MTEDKSYFSTIEIGDIVDKYGTLRMVTVKSPSLRARADLSIYMPPQITRPAMAPVVILLHGVYGSHWAWFLKGGAHKTLYELIDSNQIPPMILAAPSDGLWGDGSAYLRHNTKDFENWIVKDVPMAVAEVTENSQEAKHFIAGLSMGGYGALRLGAKYCNQFAAFSGLSSITEFEQLALFTAECPDYYGINNNPNVLEEIRKNADQGLKFRFDCGVNDPLIKYNRELHAKLKELGIEHTYEEHKGGHEWDYWEAHIATTLQYFAKHIPPS